MQMEELPSVISDIISEYENGFRIKDGKLNIWAVEPTVYYMQIQSRATDEPTTTKEVKNIHCTPIFAGDVTSGIWRYTYGPHYYNIGEETYIPMIFYHNSVDITRLPAVHIDKKILTSYLDPFLSFLDIKDDTGSTLVSLNVKDDNGIDRNRVIGDRIVSRIMVIKQTYVIDKNVVILLLKRKALKEMEVFKKITLYDKTTRLLQEIKNKAPHLRGIRGPVSGVRLLPPKGENLFGNFKEVRLTDWAIEGVENSEKENKFELEPNYVPQTEEEKLVWHFIHHWRGLLESISINEEIMRDPVYQDLYRRIMADVEDRLKYIDITSPSTYRAI